MLVKFFNGHIGKLNDLSVKDIDLSDQEQVSVIIDSIYNYILKHQNDQDNSGITNNDLMFFEQIDFFINEETDDNMIYAFIHSIHTLHIKMVFGWIQSLSFEEMTKKAEKYLQYLADKRMLSLSIGRKYCELYFQNFKENEEDEYEYMEKVSTIWEEDIDLKIDFCKIDSDKYICKNVPIYIGYQLYEPTLIFHKDDLD